MKGYRLLQQLVLRPRLVKNGRAGYASLCVEDNESSGSRLAETMAIYQIWGSNTGVGKTLISAGLAAAALRAQVPTLYLKPVQTGFPDDCDGRLVAAATNSVNTYGNHAGSVVVQHLQQGHVGGLQPLLTARTLFAWHAPVSPHLAVAQEGRAVGDEELVAACLQELTNHAQQWQARGGNVDGDDALQPAAAAMAAAAAARCLPPLALVETAGGVASPGPSGTLQCDLYRPLRLPGLLVGDGRLGGISATLASIDCLAMRGYDVPLVMLMEQPLEQEGRLDNSMALRQHLRRWGTRVISLPCCLPPVEHPEAHAAGGASAGGGGGGGGEGLRRVDEQLAGWMAATQAQFDEALGHMQDLHVERMRRLDTAASDARRQLWWPFTQHDSLAHDSQVTVIDSRCGEDWLVVAPAADGDSGPALRRMYDGCGSWWTQAVSATAHPLLAREVAYAAGRYLHVMFPENAHQPALEAASAMLDTLGAGWASRVFLSDDGSTAVEVALKMAFRTFLLRHGLVDRDAPELGSGPPTLEVLGMVGSYHGDTLGAMDCAAPSVFNGVLEQPWYRGRGLFLEPPTLGLVHGRWRVNLPHALQGTAVGGGQEHLWAERDEVFSRQRDGDALAQAYRDFVIEALDRHERQRGPGVRIGAVIMEPVLQGAGGMIMIDPLFQRVVATECRARRIPIIFDEVFTGCWRLGAASAHSLLGVLPDVACYAKLLTGGALPMAATLATSEVFDYFRGPSKLHALLHGHSYSGHPIGCHLAAVSLKMFADQELNPSWCRPAVPCKNDDLEGSSNGNDRGTCTRTPQCSAPCGHTIDYWDADMLRELSMQPNVARVAALGTVIAAELLPPPGQQRGYTSGVAGGVVQRLAEEGIYTRPLGDVVYLMATPLTSPAKCEWLLRSLLRAVRCEAKNGCDPSGTT